MTLTLMIIFLSITFTGSCKFNEVSISGVKYSQGIDLQEGDEITWSAPKQSKRERIKSILEQLKH